MMKYLKYMKNKPNGMHKYFVFQQFPIFLILMSQSFINRTLMKTFTNNKGLIMCKTIQTGTIISKTARVLRES